MCACTQTYRHMYNLSAHTQTHMHLLHSFFFPLFHNLKYYFYNIYVLRKSLCNLCVQMLYE